MVRTRWPDSQVSQETLKKQRHRENQRVKRLKKDQFWKDMGGPPPKNAAALGKNIFDSAPDHMLDQEDGSLDRDKIGKLSEAGNGAKQQKSVDELNDVNWEYGDDIKKGAGEPEIRKKMLETNPLEDIPPKRTLRHRIKSIKKSTTPSAKPKGDTF